jgi:nicotinate-nucleotide pyrophosphorylase (carboxylating)
MTPQYSHLLPPSWKSQLVAWLDEDSPSFDYGGFVVGEAQREAFLLGKGSKRAVLAGTPFVDEIFRHLDCMYVCTPRTRLPTQADAQPLINV